MKKKVMGILMVVMIVLNVLLSVPISNNHSKLSLILLEAKADGGSNESDIPNPSKPPVPFSILPIDWSFSTIIDYFF